MRVLILGGTRFIGRRIAADLVARGDEVTIVHRGQTETAEPDGCVHWHTDRAAFAELSAQVRALRPDAVIDTRAMTKADAEAVLPHLPDAHLVLLSSIDVYRAYELILAGRGGEPVPISEESPVREGRYPLRGLLPGLGALAPSQSAGPPRPGLLPRRPRPSRRRLAGARLAGAG